MSFQVKNNRNAAKRIYNLNSLNNPIILDILKSQQGKLSGPSTSTFTSITKIQQSDDKTSLLSITGKQVICPNVYTRSGKKEPNKNNAEAIKNIKEIKLILEEQSQNLSSLNERHLQALNLIQNSEYQQFDKICSQKALVNDRDIQKYYEDAIVNHPQLYSKVVSAYKSFQKTMNSKQKAKQYAKKRLSTNKITGLDKGQSVGLYKQAKTRTMIPSSKDNDGKNDQQKKKILFFNIYREFQLLINLSSQCIMIPEPEAQYKAFVGKGNNGLLIKSIIKSRPWWCIRTVTDVDNCNLIWTEWKKPKYMKILPNSKFEKKAQSPQLKQSNSINLKGNKKLQSVSKILSEQKVSQYLSCFDSKTQQEVTKFNKKISEPNFSTIVPKLLPNIQLKSVSKANKLVNHIPGCFQLHSKKLLYANLKKYYEKKKLNVFDYLPQTYVISKGLNDPEYQKFLDAWQVHQSKKDPKTSRNIWICKPGQNSNRGNGIVVAGTLNEIKNFITSHSSSNGMCSALIQKYMQNPFLYNKRKFDIRCYILITTVNGIVKGYWYEDGYIRTTSKQYNLKNIENKFIHLTNDAVQKKGQTYGKFQSFNKVSFPDFQKYLQQNYQGSNLNFKASQQKMKEMAKDLIHSVGKKLNPDKKLFSFELFGLDFMLDDKLDAFIIQANSNPCIEVEGNVLGRVIPSMLQNMIRVAIDPIFPPPYSQNAKTTKYSPGNVIQQNKFTLVYDSLQTQSSQQNIAITKQQQDEERMMQAQIERQNQEQI